MKLFRLFKKKIFVRECNNLHLTEDLDVQKVSIATFVTEECCEHGVRVFYDVNDRVTLIPGIGWSTIDSAYQFSKRLLDVIFTFNKNNITFREEYVEKGYAELVLFLFGM